MPRQDSDGTSHRYIASIHSESDNSVMKPPSTVQFRRLSSDARHAESRCNATAATASATSAASASLRSSQWQQTIAILSVSASDAQGESAGHMVNAVNMVKAVNMVISAWARGSHWLQSLANLRRMQHAQVQPDTVSFNACLNALERSSKWQRGTGICFFFSFGISWSYSLYVSCCGQGLSTKVLWVIILFLDEIVLAQMKSWRCWGSTVWHCLMRWRHSMQKVQNMQNMQKRNA